MRLFVGYATTEGQTRKIARHVGDRLADQGHGVEIMALEGAEDVDLTRFDAVVLGASLHVGHYQKALTEFVHDQVTDLSQRPTLFLSVSLAAAGHTSEEWRALEHIAEDFRAATGWTPDQIVQIAGAYTPSRYDVFRRFAMRRILAKKDPEADPNLDKEYTDWPALDSVIDTWSKRIRL